MSVLSPFVYWAQSESEIFLKIDLKDVKSPEINLNDRSIDFNGSGTGAQGTNNYAFSIVLYEVIDPKTKAIKINDNSINITLQKQQPAWWPRLISPPQKPSWLKIDFDKWQSEEDLLEEKVNNVTEDYPDVYKRLMKNELGYVKEDFKAVYMTFYNLAMLCAFIYAFLVVSITITKHHPVFYDKVYPSLGPLLCFIHLFQALEILHPIFGYVKGGCLMPFMQIFGRLFVLFGNLETEVGLQKMPVVTWLFGVWIVSDIIRYIYYLVHTSNPKNQLRKYLYPFTKWLRYSAWIILYPIGFLCESVIIFRNILYLHSNPKYYIRLPNTFNFTFDYLTFLRIYMLFFMFPGMYSLIKHMYKARVKNLGGSEPFDHLFRKKVK